MDPEILAAAIGALAVIVAALITRTWDRNRKQPATTSDHNHTVQATLDKEHEIAAPHPKGNTRTGEVLLVDDDVHLMQHLVAWLQERGYPVALVTNEAAARKVIEDVAAGRRDVALAIVDVMLPIGDIVEARDSSLSEQFFDASHGAGLRLCEYARKSLLLAEKRLPLVLFTARVDAEIRFEARLLHIPLFTKEDFSGLLKYLQQALPEVGIANLNA